ncbi:MAG: TonB-dependent receptor, partial [Gemmatimonas sp.]|nr:TonB-dependent receptor plug domain-containing protein [Gemmatimonadaceae bacterium]
MRHARMVLSSMVVCVLTASTACVTTAPHYHEEQDESAFRDIVISGDQIDAEHAQNAWDVLRRLVPRYSYSEDRAGRPLSINGHRGRSSIALSNSESPIVIVDGARLNSLDVLQQMPTDAIDRIEVRRGARGTTIEGTNAGAGVIYIHTRFGSE